MILNLNGSEKISMQDNDNGYKDIIIDGIDFKLADGTTKKVKMVFPCAKFDSDGLINADNFKVFADNIDKFLWAVELTEEN